MRGLRKGGRSISEVQCPGMSDGATCWNRKSWRQEEGRGHDSRSILNMLNLRCFQLFLFQQEGGRDKWSRISKKNNHVYLLGKCYSFCLVLNFWRKGDSQILPRIFLWACLPLYASILSSIKWARWIQYTSLRSCWNLYLKMKKHCFSLKGLW